MALDKLGASPVQQEGAQQSNRVFDTRSNILLYSILVELKEMKKMLAEMTDTEDLG